MAEWVVVDAEESVHFNRKKEGGVGKAISYNAEESVLFLISFFGKSEESGRIIF